MSRVLSKIFQIFTGIAKNNAFHSHSSLAYPKKKGLYARLTFRTVFYKMKKNEMFKQDGDVLMPKSKYETIYKDLKQKIEE